MSAASTIPGLVRSLRVVRPHLVRSARAAVVALTLLPCLAAAQPAATTPTLLWRHQYDFNYLWLMNVDKATPVGLPPVAGSNWVVGGMGDLDGDGTRDILWYETTTGAVYAWYMSGTDIKPNGIVGLGVVGPGWTIEAVADFDGDGIADILWRYATGPIYIWLLQPDGSHIAVGIASLDPTLYRLVGVGNLDLTPNSHCIMWSYDAPTAGPIPQGDVLEWGWYGSPTGLIGSAFIGNNSGKFAQRLADFDGDGIPDLLWVDAATGAVDVWFKDYAVFYTHVAMPAIAVGFQPSAAVDANSDGREDVVWFSPATGDAMQWLMNGRGNTPTQNSLGNVGTTWFVPNQ